jgi:hypothetical protein
MLTHPPIEHGATASIFQFAKLQTKNKKISYDYFLASKRIILTLF